MPSPVPDRPGLLIRDPYQYSDVTIIVPPQLVQCLYHFDGNQTELDLRETLVRSTGDIRVGDLERNLIDTLSASGFLENDVFEALREERHRNFSKAERREAVHAGSAYPAEPEALRETLLRYMGDSQTDRLLDSETYERFSSDASPDQSRAGNGTQPVMADRTFAIAAPHVSPEGGWRSYQAAYSALRPELAERTFVVLGTSHYGQPERFGLTGKAFVTPFGEARVDISLLEELEEQAPEAIQCEDYCHSIEHSIEFQIIFLQHLFGPEVRFLPILCGSFAHSIYLGGMPENDEGVRRFLDALGEIAAREGNRLFWVLGIDMAHMGRRYSDEFAARAGKGLMGEVKERDRARIERIKAGDPVGFWDLVRENRDDLKWCGSAPLYTFLKVFPKSRGELLSYEQWNIDPESVVSFAGMAFSN
jgi:AmmeMemoRadiSam system protein B